MVRSPSVVFGTLAFLIVFGAFFLPIQLRKSADLVFSNDADDYNRAALSLSHSGFYSRDGATPLVEREPGYSVFLAFVYLLFGEGNRIAIYSVTALLYLLAVFLFTRQIARRTSPAQSTLTFLMLLFFPSVFLALSLIYRELFTLSLLLLFSALFLSYQADRQMLKVVLMGILLGAAVLTYIPFLFLPFVLAALLFFLRAPRRHVVFLLVIPLLFTTLWGLRNWSFTGEFELTAGQRVDGITYMRAQKAAHLAPHEYFTCFYEEYVLRDFHNPYCLTNPLLHELGANIQSSVTTLERARAEARSLLLQHPFGFLWGSFAEVLEFHFPFFDGNTLYNIAALLAYIFLYLGVLFGIRAVRDPQYALFWVLPLYAMLVFALTDATPRYHMPTLFCYIVFSARGYIHLVERLGMRASSS